jgi:cell division transport system permease protein
MKLFFFIKEGFIGLRRARLSALISIIALCLTLSLMGILFLTGINLKDVVFQFYREVEIEAFLQPNLKSNQLNRLKERISNYPQTAKINYVSREQALEEFQKIFGNDIQSILNENPLPASIRVILKTEYSDPKSVNSVAIALSGLDGIQEVVYPKELIQFFHKYFELAIILSIIFAVVLLIIIIVLVFNTIRLTIHARRNIIQIMKLVGATNYFIKGPFILEGILQGFIGGGISAFLLWSLSQIIKNMIFPELAVMNFLFPVLVFSGILLGFVGSSISVNKYLTE